MARKAMPMSGFIKAVLMEAFHWSEAFFGQVREERRTQQIDFVYLQLTDGPPAQFLELLETIEDPKKIIEEAVVKTKGFPPPYQIQPLPGEFLKERFDESLAMQTVGHMIGIIFGGPETGSRFSKLSKDLNDIYAFLKQKFEAALAENGPEEGGQEIDETRVTLHEAEKAELIKQYSNAIFSIHLLIRKISKRDLNYGQYL